MDIVRPDYTDCLTNLSNSILKYFGVKELNSSLKDIDEILKENNSKNVVVMLLDGLGANILDRTLSDNAFLKKNKLRNLHSVFPPTTVAATSSFLSGLNPSQHGLLGWDMYFVKENKIVTTFKNTIKDSDIAASKDNLKEKYYHYTSIIDMINEKYEAYMFGKFDGIDYMNLNDLNSKIIELCNENGKKFIYAHYLEPDYTMHEQGPDSKEVKAIIKNLNQKMEQLANGLEDTTLIIIADHGHILADHITISNNEELQGMLKKDISIEGRACNFFIKQKCKNDFEDLLTFEYEKDFILYSKKQILDKEIFGTGKCHKYFKDSIGDYVAIAKGNKYFRSTENSVSLKSMHGGMTADEMLVPLIVVTKK